MALKITVSTAGATCVLRCDGRITLGEGSVTLRDATREALREGAKLLVLELSGVNYMDSSGLGELVSAYTTARNSGANLVLVGLTKRVMDLVQITKLFTVFPIFNSIEEALAADPGAKP